MAHLLGLRFKAGEAKLLGDAPVHSNWPDRPRVHAGLVPGALAVQLSRLTPGPGSPVSTTCIERAMNEHDLDSVAHWQPIQRRHECVIFSTIVHFFGATLIVPVAESPQHTSPHRQLRHALQASPKD